MIRLSVSPCSNPELELEPLLAAYSRMGYTVLEQFSGWVHSAFDYRRDPGYYKEILARYGMTLGSYHLPAIKEDTEEAVHEAVSAAKFASALGASVVIFKAASRELYIKTARRFLDAIEPYGITPVLQNHMGSPITTLEDYKEVIAGINDARMKTVLEVGHFHSAGVSWREGYELLKGTIALVHIKDQIGKQSVPFGKGEIDLPGLFERLVQDRYDGDVVVEMEVEDHENTLTYLEDAYHYVNRLLKR